MKCEKCGKDIPESDIDEYIGGWEGWCKKCHKPTYVRRKEN